jgi:hypothetical protein
MQIVRTMTILLAIADYEGFNRAGSRAQRNNNPGNIEFGAMARRFNASLEIVPCYALEFPRFAYFSDSDAGWACLRELLTNTYIGMTIAATFNKYAPPIENNTNAYAEFVCKQTGLTLDTVLTTENIG